MRRFLMLGLSLAALLGGYSSLAYTETRPIPPTVMARAPGRTELVRVSYFQRRNLARVNFFIDKLPTPILRNTQDGVELVVATAQPIRLFEYARRVREVAALSSRQEDGQAVIAIRLACDCEVSSTRNGRVFSIDLRDRPGSKARAPSKAEATTEHTREQEQTKEQEQLRAALTAKLSQLNARPPSGNTAPTRSQGEAGASAEPQADAAAPPQRPACAPDFDMATWKRPGKFTTALAALRRAAADTHEAAPELAKLAEFYISDDLAGEAVDVANTALNGDTPLVAADRQRLQRDADIASLLRGDIIDTQSPLLAEPANCDRTDLPLWRALKAAAGHDVTTVRRDAHAAAMALDHVPEPLLQDMAFRLANAAGDNIAALRAFAAAVRNSSLGTLDRESARFLLQARIARLGGDDIDELVFLRRAAQHPRTVPGMTATERLAEMGLARGDATASHDEMLLTDMARVYRSDQLGRDAAAALAENRLRQKDYAGALAIADESASPNGVRDADSRGAALAAKILRTILAGPAAASLNPDQRIALYLKYSGYATPGRPGDDIRMAAATLLLKQGMASAALDAVRQFSDETAATPDGKTLRAAAEARAGDPSAALLLLQEVPATSATRRIAADAYEKMGRPADAAHQLDGLTGVADETRRAALLCDAKAWADAATAYADLLRNPGLSEPARRDAADRYGYALALSGGSPDRTLVPVSDKAAAQTLAALPPSRPAPPGAALTYPAMKDALDRAKRIETLLPPAGSDKGP
ncbi:hypothetical protein [Rhodopila globiformis]|uniref:Uncharacterized protein n=1 Tax=Rhodopila globiformis TaxID=1071 RepID=A0A2S6MZ44_RHOGL|nr:hypothetical protein [Rhodopila globiformis]PPQ27622.1 hypothetical protein CCS01_26780 [Rhodopila globiformis]